MTKEQGKVGVAATIPILGKVIGAKTLEEVKTGRSVVGKEEPAVVTKPLSPPKPR